MYKTKAEQKTFYNSAAWQRVRKEAMKRDNYECQQCKREGKVHVDSVKSDGERKTVELNVHHKKEIEHHPDLALTLDNLETVCVYHHNKEHGRFAFREPKWNDERW